MKTVWEDYLATVEAMPAAVAAEDGRTALTYSELHKQVAAYQAALLGLGVAKGDLAGVVMCRDVRLPAMLLAIFGLGAAYLPLDPVDPPLRMQRAIKLAKCTFVIGNRTHIEAYQAGVEGSLDPKCHAVEDLDTATPADVAAPGPTPGMLAYVLMTSGSTGEPKAVSVAHSNVTTLLNSARSHLAFTPADRYFATSSLTFDASIPELFLPLTTGGRVVIRDRDIVLSPKAMVATIKEAGVSIVQTTPSTWATILYAVEDFPRVRLLITHGEPVTPAFAANLATRADRVLNMYGPTETTVWATSLEVTPEIAALRGQGAAPIGIPLDHISALVTDADGAPVADGTSGELCLGGASVTQGYRNDPDRTGRAFFESGGVRYYRTGDLVARAPDGVIRYLGRIDDQMAINGLRIEPGEIEAALMTHPMVGRVAVTWYETASDARSIVAAIVPKPGKSVTPTDLRNHLSHRLNRSFLPSQYLFFGELPALTSGKVDRGAIREAAIDAAQFDQTPVAEVSSAVEQKMLEIWTSVLKTSDVGTADDFFLMGGDSLRAVDLMVQIEQAFGVELSIQDIFDHPTLAAMSTQIGTLVPEEHQTPEASLMVGFRTELPGPPLFFAHADLDYPNATGRAIPTPFYNLLLWSRAEGIVNEASLQDLSAKYVREITAVQPTGPYRLAGYSIGGIIIHDVARQLMQLGHDIEFLFLLDPTPPGFIETTGQRAIVAPRKRNLSTRVSARLDRVARSLKGETKAGWARTLVESPRYLNEARHWLAYRRVSARIAASGDRAGARFDEATQWRAIRYAVGRMVATYSAKPLGVPTILVTSHPDMAEVWDGLLRPDDARHRIEADHRGAFRAAANGIWTEILLDAMTRADEPQTAPTALSI